VTERVSTRSLIEKLGVSSDSRVTLLRVDDPAFLHDLERVGADVSPRLRRETDLIFLSVESISDLGRLAELEPFLRRNGAVWAVFRKGRKELREVDVIEAGVAAGLVDNKVVRFSDTHTALRFVIPLARR
jgi:hypothetical protein